MTRNNDEALATLRILVADPDGQKVGRAFSSKVVELALSSVPGFTLAQPPGEATQYFGFWPALVDAAHVAEVVHVGGEEIAIAPRIESAPLAPYIEPAAIPAAPEGPRTRERLGRRFGARSGNKGGTRASACGPRRARRTRFSAST